MRQLLLIAWAIAAISTASAQTSSPSSAQLLEVRKIWDAAEHSAFTDLTRWRGAWWCTFREATDHVSKDGKIRVLTSKDGQPWESAALVDEKDIDLRDPKFSVTPDGRLMIVCARMVQTRPREAKNLRSAVLFSNDGRTWTAPAVVLTEGAWLWRVVWHDGTAYGAAYRPLDAGERSRAPDAPDWTLNLHSSKDGLTWDLVGPMEVSGRPNETTIRFLANGDLVAMVRGENGTRMGWIGVTRAPYTRWTWHENNYRFGGPNFIQLPDGSLVAGTRDYTQLPASVEGKSNGKSNKARTIVGYLTPDAFTLEPFAILPSAGDNSYPGLVWHEGVLWVSYYSTHEGKTSIYLAKVKLPETSSKTNVAPR